MAHDQRTLDERLRSAVAAIDAGDVRELDRQLAADPALLRERLTSPGPWLRSKIGGALDGFFKAPYLLWFVAEDPVRNGTLPANIADVARAIVQAAAAARVESLQEQLDYALRLVAWSWIARGAGVQIPLLDVLIDAGAASAGAPEDALVNGNVEAASHLVARGAPLSLAAAACLDRPDDLDRLGPLASAREKQFALVLAALRGKAAALSRIITLGGDVARPSRDLYAHATPLHHAVSSGSLDAVRMLVEAGAPLDRRDTVHDGTPLGWAEYGKLTEIAAYLQSKGAR
jgi:peptide-methionine (S)-S-oxide reductase